MRLRLLTTASLTLLLLGAGCADIGTRTSVTTDGWTTYGNPACEFSFEYPIGWTVTDEATAVSIVSPETDQAVKDFMGNTIGGEIGPTFDFSAECWPTIKAFAIASGYEDFADVANVKDFLAA